MSNHVAPGSGTGPRPGAARAAGPDHDAAPGTVRTATPEPEVREPEARGRAARKPNADAAGDEAADSGRGSVDSTESTRDATVEPADRGREPATESVPVAPARSENKRTEAGRHRAAKPTDMAKVDRATLDRDNADEAKVDPTTGDRSNGDRTKVAKADKADKSRGDKPKGARKVDRAQAQGVGTGRFGSAGRARHGLTAVAARAGLTVGTAANSDVPAGGKDASAAAASGGVGGADSNGKGNAGTPPRRETACSVTDPVGRSTVARMPRRRTGSRRVVAITAPATMAAIDGSRPDQRGTGPTRPRRRTVGSA